MIDFLTLSFCCFVCYLNKLFNFVGRHSLVVIIVRSRKREVTQFLATDVIPLEAFASIRKGLTAPQHSLLHHQYHNTLCYTTSTTTLSASPPVPQHSLLHHQYHNTLCYTTSTTTLSATPPVPQHSLLHHQYHNTLCYTTSTTTLSASPPVPQHSLLHHQYHNTLCYTTSTTTLSATPTVPQHCTCLMSLHSLLHHQYHSFDIRYPVHNECTQISVTVCARI